MHGGVCVCVSRSREIIYRTPGLQLVPSSFLLPLTRQIVAELPHGEATEMSRSCWSPPRRRSLACLPGLTIQRTCPVDKPAAVACCLWAKFFFRQKRRPPCASAARWKRGWYTQPGRAVCSGSDPRVRVFARVAGLQPILDARWSGLGRWFLPLSRLPRLGYYIACQRAPPELRRLRATSCKPTRARERAKRLGRATKVESGKKEGREKEGLRGDSLKSERFSVFLQPCWPLDSRGGQGGSRYVVPIEYAQSGRCQLFADALWGSESRRVLSPGMRAAGVCFACLLVSSCNKHVKCFP